MKLIPIANNLWSTTQPLRFLGLEVGTRMTVVRLSSSDLVLISPIALSKSVSEGDRAAGSQNNCPILD
ncbi:MAG: hypothetical protein WBA10_10805, partial [Elainellaceae cyanobacterium]